LDTPSYISFQVQRLQFSGTETIIMNIKHKNIEFNYTIINLYSLLACSDQ